MHEISHDPHALLMLQFLAWIGEDGRSHAETMEAWRSSCPRLSVWEDSLDAGLVTVAGSAVTLAAPGRALLARDGGAEPVRQVQGRVCGVAS
ncbi:hypothetical protein [Elioraea sp.]|uniref:hypothetical protein n=1 Tax=Elioraea sp. TaxID=2185103 RepID=UPI0025BA60B1|nr:hypothetical protein [Elioraea sp.]